MPDYIGFFLNSKTTIVQFETVELTHPSFSKIYRLVRNNMNGLTATLETAAVVNFDYCPMKIESRSMQDDLDYAVSIEIGDLGEIVPTELDSVEDADSFAIKPIMKYRLYRSDDLTSPMFGPIVLEVTEFAFNKTGCRFDAHAPLLNLLRTGEVYSIDRFSSLRGFL
jgi:hypothetical protein